MRVNGRKKVSKEERGRRGERRQANEQRREKRLGDGERDRRMRVGDVGSGFRIVSLDGLGGL